MSLIDDIVKAIEAREKKPRGYDSEAKVVRIDGDTAYVHLPGGVPETPVKRTISCKVGDKVQVRVSGGRATITGNATAPPTDDTKAEAADGKAVEAEKTAQSALEKALEGIKLTDAQAERLTEFFTDFVKDGLIKGDKVNAKELNANEIFAKNVKATGTIEGATLRGAELYSSKICNADGTGELTISSHGGVPYISLECTIPRTASDGTKYNIQSSIAISVDSFGLGIEGAYGSNLDAYDPGYRSLLLVNADGLSFNYDDLSGNIPFN